MDVQVNKRQTEGHLKAKGIGPSLTVTDIEKSIHFYTEGLGFGIDDEFESDGKVVGLMMKAGGAHLGISQDDFAKGRDRVKGVGMRMWIPTEQDVTELADRARAAGITLDEGPAVTEWGAMAFTVTDPDGFKLTIFHESK